MCMLKLTMCHHLASNQIRQSGDCRLMHTYNGTLYYVLPIKLPTDKLVKYCEALHYCASWMTSCITLCQLVVLHCAMMSQVYTFVPKASDQGQFCYSDVPCLQCEQPDLLFKPHKIMSPMFVHTKRPVQGVHGLQGSMQILQCVLHW